MEATTLSTQPAAAIAVSTLPAASICLATRAHRSARTANCASKGCTTLHPYGYYCYHTASHMHCIVHVLLSVLCTIAGTTDWCADTTPHIGGTAVRHAPLTVRALSVVFVSSVAAPARPPSSWGGRTVTLAVAATGLTIPMSFIWANTETVTARAPRGTRATWSDHCGGGPKTHDEPADTLAIRHHSTHTTRAQRDAKRG